MTSLLLVMVAAGGGNLLRNGDFESGLDNWSINQAWYAQPQGGATSAVEVADGEGRGGGRAARLVGGGLRGIALQQLPAYPGRYHVTGWVRCRGLATAGGVLIEWLGPDGWIAGERVANVTGDADWTFFEATVTAPPRTRSVHFDLLTDAPNDGTIWFDEMTMERLPSNLPPPPAPTIAAETPAGAEGCLRVTWDQAAGDQAVLLLLYAATEPLGDPAGRLPVAVADAEAGEALVRGLPNGSTWHVAAIASDGDGQVSPPSAAVRATVADRQPPRPGWGRSLRLGDQTYAGWKPHVLDNDVARVGIRVGDAPATMHAATAHLVVPVPGDPPRLGFFAEDAAGQVSETVWVDTERAPADDAAPGPWTAWLAPPTEQLPVDAPAPAEPAKRLALFALRGQTVGCQLFVRPAEPVAGAWVRAGAADGLIGDYRFVDYLSVPRNSRATPPEELVWPVPAEYPEKLDDEPVRDLPAGRLQPIYLRVDVPADQAPGRYDVPFELVGGGGRERVIVEVEVAPVTLPKQCRLVFNYWYDQNEPCRAFGVDSGSEDGWRALARVAEQMAAYRQNSVLVSYGLIDAWQRPDGSLAADFRQFDRYVETFQAAGVDRLFCLTHFGSRTNGRWEDTTFSAHRMTIRRLPDGAPTEIVALELLPLIQEHLEQRGWLDRFAVHVADEPIAVNRESWLELSAALHAKAPKLRRIDAIHIPNLIGGLEIFVPELNYLAQWHDEFRAAQAAGVELWMYVAWVPQGKYPNRMIDGPAIKPRVLHWMHYRYGSTGYLHWALNRWSMDLMALESPGDTTITWAARREIAASSLRYEAERAGLEDLELMYLAEDALVARGVDRAAAREQVLAVTAAAVRDVEDYSRSWAELEAVRRRLVEVIAG